MNHPACRSRAYNTRVIYLLRPENLARPPYVCACVCIRTHTHTHTYIIYDRVDKCKQTPRHASGESPGARSNVGAARENETTARAEGGTYPTHTRARTKAERHADFVFRVHCVCVAFIFLSPSRRAEISLNSRPDRRVAAVVRYTLSRGDVRTTRVTHFIG